MCKEQNEIQRSRTVVRHEESERGLQTVVSRDSLNLSFAEPLHEQLPELNADQAEQQVHAPLGQTRILRQNAMLYESFGSAVFEQATRTEKIAKMYEDRLEGDNIVNVERVLNIKRVIRENGDQMQQDTNKKSAFFLEMQRATQHLQELYERQDGQYLPELSDAERTENEVQIMEALVRLSSAAKLYKDNHQ